MRTRPTECWTLQGRVGLERVLVAACFMALTLVVSPPAPAQSVRVAVIHSAAHEEAARRLRAEVSAAGLDALDVPVSPSERRSTASITFALHAVSALRIEADGNLEIVVIDSATGAVLERSLLSAQGLVHGPELTAVEDLRAKLVELSIALPESSAEVRATAEVPAPIGSQTRPPLTSANSAAEPGRRAHFDRGRSEPPRRLDAGAVWLQAAAGGALSNGGLSANAVARLGLRVEPWERWSVSALTVLPLSSQQVAAASGHATVNVLVFGAALSFAPLRFQTAEFEIGLGGGAALCEMRGVPSSGLDVGRSQSLWSGVALADTAFAWYATRRLRIRAALLAGLASPRSAVRFEGESVGTWGRPFASGTLGIELESFATAPGAP